MLTLANPLSWPHYELFPTFLPLGTGTCDDLVLAGFRQQNEKTDCTNSCELKTP